MHASPPARLPGLDALKGIAIIGVVAIHAAPSGAPLYLEHGINGVARLAVPLFLVVSGFLLGARPPSRAKAGRYFWKFARLHLLYGAFYWAVQPLVGVPYAPLTPKSAVMHFAAFSYAGQFYLFALTQLYFAFAFLVPERLWSSPRLLAAAALLHAGTVVALVWSLGATGASPLLRVLVGQAEATAALWLLPFCLGTFVGGRFARAPGSGAGAARCALLALGAVALVTLDLPPTGGAGYAERFPYARWSISLGAALLALAVPFASRRLRLGPVAALGRESFGIFVLNPLILGVLRLHLGDIESVPESALYLALTLAIAYGLARVLRPRIPFAFP